MGFNSADIGAFKDIWVFCEQRDGKLMETDFELLSEGRSWPTKEALISSVFYWAIMLKI